MYVYADVTKYVCTDSIRKQIQKIFYQMTPAWVKCKRILVTLGSLLLQSSSYRLCNIVL